MSGLPRVSVTAAVTGRGAGNPVAARVHRASGLPWAPSASPAREPSFSSVAEACGDDPFPIHQGSIHERRLAAVLARAFPLACFLATVGLAVIGAARAPMLLLALCASLNLCLCLGMCSSGVLSIIGARRVSERLQELSSQDLAECDQAASAAKQAGVEPSPADHERSSMSSMTTVDLESSAGEGTDGAVHLVVIPNYKEDEELLAQTLQSIAEARDASTFHVVLATEVREGESAVEKARRLKERFGHHFARCLITSHPEDLVETHLDGSADDEVPGKASNLKWALQQVQAGYKQEGLISMDNVVLTVADADVLFHPGYFAQIRREFNALREASGSEHLWTMWQAPQLPFRNYCSAPACSRVWAYVASVHELGGIAGLGYGGDHLVFSTYSMPLLLAIRALAHDGDVIAEDHHAHIKSFFYAARASVLRAIDSGVDGACCAPQLRLRPLYLPVKSTSVVSAQGCLQTWIDRWAQAKRHARGVAELSYCVLAAHDTFCLLPTRMMSRALLLPIARMIAHLLYVHLLPSCQFVAMAALQAHFLWHGRAAVCLHDASGGGAVAVAVAAAPQGDPVRAAAAAEYLVEGALCGLAGARVPAWPVALPLAFVILSNVLFISVAFLQPAARGGTETTWSAEDGGLRARAPGFPRLALGARVAFDCLVWGAPLVVPYGIVVEVLAFWGVLFQGNRFTYVTATKAMSCNPLVPERPLLLADND